VATNPIDQCWRCKPDWETDRKALATCALGFGAKTTGGAAGEIYTVTEPTDDDCAAPKPGTLRFGVTQEGPLWIIFASDMTIKLTQELLIGSDKTIDGRGFQVQISDGGGFTIKEAQNVIIHGLQILNGVPSTNGDGDGITVSGSTNVWLDHISLTNCTDGLADVTQGSTAVTISNCHFSHHDKVTNYFM
jgi:pectate lyase